MSRRILCRLMVVAVISSGLGYRGAAMAQEIQPDATPAADAGPDATPAADAGPDAEVFKESVSEAAIPEFVGKPVLAPERPGVLTTGSLLRRKEKASLTPVTTIEQRDLGAAGAISIAEVMRNLMVGSNGITLSLSADANRVSLRGLGPGRTLVLINGRRHVPGGRGADASVDLNAIPVAMIKRIEVQKSGASMLYGSGAIAGVVNIITRDDLERTEASVFSGVTRGGGEVLDVSATVGRNFGRAHVVLSAGYFRKGPVLGKQRSFGRRRSFDWDGYAQNQLDPTSGCDPNRPADAPADANNLASCVSSVASSATPGGTIIDRTGALGNQAWQDLVTAYPGSNFFYGPGQSWRGPGADMSLQDNAYPLSTDTLVSPQERFHLFSTGNAKLTSNIRAYYEASYSRWTSKRSRSSTPVFTIINAIAVSGQNAYNPFGRDFIDLRFRFLNTKKDVVRDRDTFRFVAGVDGTLPGLPVGRNWRWDLSYNYGRTQGTLARRLFLGSRLEGALGPSYTDGNGSLACGTAANPIAGCVPLNLFEGQGGVTREMLDYVQYNASTRGVSTQSSVLAKIDGELARLPSGRPIRLAVGLEHRRESGLIAPDAFQLSGDAIGSDRSSTTGVFSVNSGFAEVGAVVLEGIPYLQSLEVSAGLRVSARGKSHTGISWQSGARWQVLDEIAWRTTLSSAFRSPSLDELYLRGGDSFPFLGDPCDTSQGPLSPIVATNCAAQGVPATHIDTRSQLRASVRGNPLLRPETARVFTTGVVLEPRQVKGLSVTLDYFNIELSDSVSLIGPSRVLSDCYLEVQPRNCNRVVRDGASAITLIEDSPVNAERSAMSGIDIATRVHRETPVGTLELGLDASWLLSYKRTDDDGNVTQGKGVYDLGAFPGLRTTWSARWARKNAAAGLSVHHVGSLRECRFTCSVLNAPTPVSRDVGAHVTTNLFGSYVFDRGFGNTTLTLGINNLFDQNPPTVYAGPEASSDPSAYDFQGRFFYARLNHAL